MRGDMLKKELGIHTFGDLLRHFPFRYVDKTKFHKIRDINSESNAVQLKGDFENRAKLALNPNLNQKLYQKRYSRRCRVVRSWLTGPSLALGELCRRG